MHISCSADQYKWIYRVKQLGLRTRCPHHTVFRRLLIQPISGPMVNTHRQMKCIHYIVSVLLMFNSSWDESMSCTETTLPWEATLGKWGAGMRFPPEVQSQSDLKC